MANKPTTVEFDMGKVPPRLNAAQIRDVIRRANGGDDAALVELRPILDLMPALADDLGDISRIALTAWLDRTAGDQLAFRESLKRKADSLQAELVLPSDGPLERLLAERAVVCWLHLGYAEGTYAKNMDTLDTDWSDHYQRRIDRAQRRYLQALRTLAQVRRLAVPAVQINVAEQQINQVNGGPARSVA